jgi:hypothetical protein
MLLRTNVVKNKCCLEQMLLRTNVVKNKCCLGQILFRWNFVQNIVYFEWLREIEKFLLKQLFFEQMLFKTNVN